jgi:hypothetical protein
MMVLELNGFIFSRHRKKNYLKFLLDFLEMIMDDIQVIYISFEFES